MGGRESRTQDLELSSLLGPWSVTQEQSAKGSEKPHYLVGDNGIIRLRPMSSESQHQILKDKMHQTIKMILLRLLQQREHSLVINVSKQREKT